MSRVINTQNPGKIRNQHRRAIAEILRRLMEKPTFDDDAKDMAAKLVYLLREINETVEQTVVAWEKRDYWMKAERFARDWEWTKQVALDMEDVLRHDAWDLLPELLGELFPNFADIQIKKMTRKPDLWHGAFKQLMAEKPTPLPY